MEFTLLASILAACLALLMYLSRVGKREPGLPPGPSTIPIFGNMLSFPKAFSHLQLTVWAREYGEIYSLKMGPGTVVVLSSAESVRTLLDVNGSLTGDRPQLRVMTELTEGKNVATHGTHTDVWKLGRKAIQRFLTPEMVDAHFGTQTVESILLLHDILTAPEKLYAHIRRTTASIMTFLLFGKHCDSTDTEHTFEMFHAGQSIIDPVFSAPVEFLPILRHFNPWKSAIQSAVHLRRKFFIGLLDECIQNVPSGNLNPFMKEIWKNQTQLGLSQVEIEQLATLLLEAGSVTSSGVMYNLIFALICFPEVQAKAQEEIDYVIGSERLPVMADLAHLPYVSALIKETHRFRPVLPTGIPHAALKDIEYQGYLIPKGSTIFLNVWGIHHDPGLYEQPDVFMPERFLETEYGTKAEASSGAMHSNLVFGAGRRRCPGEHFATNFVALNTMLLLWSFKFGPGISTAGAGHPLDLSNYDSPCIELTPKKFTCEITPRGQDRVDLIKQSFAQCQVS